MDLNHLLSLLWSLIGNWCSLVGHLHLHPAVKHLIRCSCFPKFVYLCTFWYQPEEQSHAMGQSKVTLLPKYPRKSTFHREVLISSCVPVYVWHRETHPTFETEKLISCLQNPFVLFFTSSFFWRHVWVLDELRSPWTFLLQCVFFSFHWIWNLSLTVAGTVMWFCGSVMEHMQFPQTDKWKEKYISAYSHSENAANTSSRLVK